MRIPILIATLFMAFSTHSFAQVLELINPATNTSIITVLPGASFSLNIEIVGPPTTPDLDSFDITMSGSTTSTTTFPTGITFTGFSNLVSGFLGGPGNAPNTSSFSAVATAGDLAFSFTPIIILTANFTLSNTLSLGTYAIDFPPSGTFQGLYDINGNSISYTPANATLDVVPEPSTWASLLIGLGVLASRVWGLKKDGTGWFNLDIAVRRPKVGQSIAGRGSRINEALSEVMQGGRKPILAMTLPKILHF